MASNINPNNINGDYPIAGVDNDSQGFRDNFTNIRTNFAESKDEIEDLQSKVLLKGALQGGTIDNNMNGNTISSVVLKDARGIVSNTSNAQGSVDIDVKAASYHKVITVDNIELSFINWPGAGQYSKVEVEIEIIEVTPGNLVTVTLPSAVNQGANNIQQYNNNVIHYSSTGTYVYEFSSIDGGFTINVQDKSRSGTDFYRTGITQVGLPGDRKGMMYFDNTAIYICISDYDGSAHIWKKVPIDPVW